MIGYVIGREVGYWLLLRYGGYLRITEGRIKLGQYLSWAWRPDHSHRSVLTGFALCRRDPCRSQSDALAAFHADQYHRRISLGDVLWARRDLLGRQAEKFGGWMVFVLGLGLLILIVVAAVLVGRHETQLTAEAEQALPGPLELR